MKKVSESYETMYVCYNKRDSNKQAFHFKILRERNNSISRIHIYKIIWSIMEIILNRRVLYVTLIFFAIDSNTEKINFGPRQC